MRHHIVPWYDENGIYYIGLEDFCLDYIEEVAPDMDAIFSGNRIMVKTLDLNQPFEAIKEQLNNIIVLFESQGLEKAPVSAIPTHI